MVAFVTGAAGFIGSNLVDRLLELGDVVIGYDNISSGNRKNLSKALNSPNFRLIEGDLLDSHYLSDSMPEGACVYHLAANADVRHGLDDSRRDLEQNTICTYNVLDICRKRNASKILFSSTGSVYGEAHQFPTPENAEFPIQTSLYGASKLACEGLISAFSEGYGLKALVFRFVSILGPRYSHGHVVDFYNQLMSDSSTLRILGNGKQRKSYLHVKDCIDAILLANQNQTSPFEIYNLGSDEYCEVIDSAGWICEELGFNPRIITSFEDRGWIGDNPFIFLDTQKIRKLGWSNTISIHEGVKATVKYLKAQ